MRELQLYLVSIGTAQSGSKGCFCVRNGSVTPREEGFAKQSLGMLLGEWFSDGVTAEANPVSIKWSRRWTVSHKQNGSLLWYYSLDRFS
jgi:hypothetical protein